MRFLTLDDWLDWQATLHPAEIELGLERVSEVWRHLRPDGLGSKVITIAGTNGKGSTAAMLEMVYLQSGYRVGLYTSPHLIRYNERIRVDGAEVSDNVLCTAFDRVDRARKETTLTYFEFGTLAALDIFASQSLDLIILEVGLGGRLDAVNILDPDLAIITTVDLDHTDWLGETREEIGYEKAGVMRPNRPVILGDTEMPASVLEHARNIGAVCLRFGMDFTLERQEVGFTWHGRSHRQVFEHNPSLVGDFQFRNAALVLMTVECFSDVLPVTPGEIAMAMQTTRLKGRFQRINGDIPIILDVAHNPQSVMTLRDNLAQLTSGSRLHAVFGLLSDKDLGSILRLIEPMIDSWHLVGIETSRGQSARQLMSAMRKSGVETRISAFASVSEALDSARAAATVGDAILIFGSFIVVGQALDLLEKNGAAELKSSTLKFNLTSV